MTISLTRKILLVLLLGIQRFLWFIDQLYSYRFNLFFVFAVLVGTGYYSYLFGTFVSQAADHYLSVLYPLSYSHVEPEQNAVLSAFSRRTLLPKRLAQLTVPALSAKSVLAVDSSGIELYEEHADEILAPASTVKLLTALVAVDLYKLDDVVNMPEHCTTLDASMTGFPANQQFYVRDLLSSLLVNSGADSACALSETAVPVENFIILLNEKAKRIGMAKTYITSPIGLDDPLGQQKTTARDLVVLAQEVIKNSDLEEIVSKTFETVYSVDGSSMVSFGTTNRMLLEVPNSVGIKTGTTTEAGQVLIYRYQDESRDFIIVVMGSEDRFYDTKALLEWILSSYVWS